MCASLHAHKPTHTHSHAHPKTHTLAPRSGQVDATKEAELAQKHEVSGYPTIKWFVDGELASDYNGARDA